MLRKQNSLPGALLFLVQFIVISGCKMSRLQLFLNFFLFGSMTVKVSKLKAFSNISFVSYFYAN